MENRHDEYVRQVKSAVTRLWDAFHDLEALQTEWNALDYGNTLSPSSRYGYDTIPVAHVGSAVFDTAIAMRALLEAGHKTNLARLLEARSGSFIPPL